MAKDKHVDNADNYLLKAHDELQKFKKQTREQMFPLRDGLNDLLEAYGFERVSRWNADKVHEALFYVASSFGSDSGISPKEYKIEQERANSAEKRAGSVEKQNGKLEAAILSLAEISGFDMQEKVTASKLKQFSTYLVEKTGKDYDGLEARHIASEDEKNEFISRMSEYGQNNGYTSRIETLDDVEKFLANAKPVNSTLQKQVDTLLDNTRKYVAEHESKERAEEINSPGDVFAYIQTHHHQEGMRDFVTHVLRPYARENHIFDTETEKLPDLENIRKAITMPYHEIAQAVYVHLQSELEKKDDVIAKKEEVIDSWTKRHKDQCDKTESEAKAKDAYRKDAVDFLTGLKGLVDQDYLASRQFAQEQGVNPPTRTGKTLEDKLMTLPAALQYLTEERATDQEDYKLAITALKQKEAEVRKLEEDLQHKERIITMKDDRNAALSKENDDNESARKSFLEAVKRIAMSQKWGGKLTVDDWFRNYSGVLHFINTMGTQYNEMLEKVETSEGKTTEEVADLERMVESLQFRVADHFSYERRISKEGKEIYAAVNIKEPSQYDIMNAGGEIPAMLYGLANAIVGLDQQIESQNSDIENLTKDKAMLGDLYQTEVKGNHLHRLKLKQAEREASEAKTEVQDRMSSLRSDPIFNSIVAALKPQQGIAYTLKDVEQSASQVLHAARMNGVGDNNIIEVAQELSKFAGTGLLGNTTNALITAVENFERFGNSLGFKRQLAKQSIMNPMDAVQLMIR